MTSFYRGIIGPKINVDIHRMNDTMDKNKHRHDGRYQIRDGFIFDGRTDQGDYIRLNAPATFTFKYASTHDGYDWYRVDSGEQDVHCTMRTHTSSFPSLTNYFIRLGDVSHAVPETPVDVENKRQRDGRYRAKKNYGFVGTTHKGVEVEIVHPDEFDFEYAGTIDGVDWYSVVGPKGEATVKVHKNCIPGVAQCFEKIGSLKGPAKEPCTSPPAQKIDDQRYDGTYRVKPGKEFRWNGNNPLGGFCQVVVKPEGLFTFRYCSTNASGGHVFEVQGDDRVVLGNWADDIAALVPHVLAPDLVQKISSSTNLEAKMPDHDPRSKFDGTYQVKPGGSFEWHGQGDAADVGPGGYFTFRHVADNRYEIQTNATTVVGTYLDINNIVKEIGQWCWLRPSNVAKISDSTEWNAAVNLPKAVASAPKKTDPLPVPTPNPGLLAAEHLLRSFGIHYDNRSDTHVRAYCYRGHDALTPSMSLNADGHYYCFGCGVKGHSLDELSIAIKAHRAQEKPAPVAPKKEDTLDTTYKSLANTSAMLKTLQSLLVFDVVTSATCTLRAQCFRGCKDPRAGTLRIDVPSGQYRCTVCGVQGPDQDHLIYSIKAHRATTSASAQKVDTMDTNSIKQAFNMTNIKAAAAVKTGAEQAGAHVAHEIVIAQVEKLLGARFPAEFYATEIGRAVISMGSAYCLMLTTQVVQHPLASKANHVAELALTAATYESAGPLLAKAKEFVEGTFMAAMNAGVDLESK